MGLSADQVALVQKAWDPVRHDLKRHSIEFFITLFAAHPSYQNLFDKLGGLSADQLRTSPKMKAHASLVFHALSSIIANLDDTDCVLAQLDKKIGDHKDRKVSPEHFKNLGDCLITYLGKTLGGAFDANTKAAWVATYDIIMSVVKQKL